MSPVRDDAPQWQTEPSCFQPLGDRSPDPTPAPRAGTTIGDGDRGGAQIPIPVPNGPFTSVTGCQFG